MRTRAERRHNNKRKQAQVARLFTSYPDADKWDAERARRTYNHACACSCWMCGNERRGPGGLRTIQERRAFQEDS